MAKRFPIRPAHPERNCWGCDDYCAADAMKCGNGSDRTQHPVELFGDDWAAWGLDPVQPGDAQASDGSGRTSPLPSTGSEIDLPSDSATPSSRTLSTSP